MSTAFLIAAAALAVAYGLWGPARGDSLRLSVIKTGSVGLLAATSLIAGGPILLTVALALGAAGDWFLSRAGHRAFLTGMAAFGAAHLAYVLLIQQGPVEPTVAGWVLCLAGAVVLWFLWPRAVGLQIPVAFYVAVILTMGFVALGSGQVLIIVAALAFILSDALLSLDLFVLAPDDPRRVFVGRMLWALYWSAQALFLVAFGGA